MDELFCIIITINILKHFQIFLKRRKGKQLLDNSDNKDNTPLHIAALQGNNKVVKVRVELFISFKQVPQEIV